ncbi:hypothetical protein [Fluviicola taffensis]|uniref:Uncharacterized protein n=1 Tax=Fluviicola taffensis (strain DSM 16823 / NCIMB 13979 / RW262) TaxID=755732 RepID=F2IA59_FLUTR|nr:hypothetical protein [Fluviicola taffensis]AEA45236.1 hypothetical protein Fluta_3263 [Fluviicola taffensis DSM 16823]
MFDLIGALFYLILEAGMFLAGAILLIYGLYSFTVPKFDESVRIFCLFLGTILIACGIGLHWFSNSDSKTENPEFVGNYITSSLHRHNN